MKKFACILSCLLFGQLFAGEVVLKGDFKLNDGGKPTAGLVHFIDGMIKDGEPIVVKTDDKGHFTVKLRAPGRYGIVAGHPGYAGHRDFMELDSSMTKPELRVVLDRHQADPKGEYAVLFESDEWDWKKKVTMVPQEDGTYLLEKEVSEDKVRYQVAGPSGSYNNLGSAVDMDGYGDFISEIVPENGKIRIIFNPKLFNLGEGDPNSHLENIAQLEVPLAIMRFQKGLRKNNSLIRSKYESKTFTTDGLEDLFKLGEEVIAGVENEEDKILVSVAINAYVKRFDERFDRMDDLMKLYEANPKILERCTFTQVLSVMYKKEGRKFTPENRDEMQKKQIAFLEDYIKLNVSQTNIADTYGYISSMLRDEPAEQRKWMQRVIDEYPKSWQASNTKNQLGQMALVGQEAPAFTLNNQFGEPVSLEQFKGKYVLLDFWASWCGPCIAEIPNLVETYKDIDKEKVAFVSICLDMEKNKLKEFVSSREMDWTQLGTMGNTKAQVAKDYSISYLPNIILVSPDGKVLRQNNGLRGDELKTTLEKYAPTN